jgi:hypothetical protein
MITAASTQMRSGMITKTTQKEAFKTIHMDSNNDCLYHLTDETGNVYYNYIIICGEPWPHRELRKHHAALYTYGEMLVAKHYFSRKKIRTFEKRVDKPGYKKRTNDKPTKIS